MPSHPASQAEWFSRVAQWRVSGLTRTAYCEQNDLKLHTLIYWIKRSNKHHTDTAKPLTLVPARICAAPQKKEDVLILQCPNGSTLRLPPTTPAAWLGTLLSHLS